MNVQLQNILIISVMLGFALMEFVSRRYKATVNATSNDTKLELLMFLSLLAITQPLALLVSGKLCEWLIPDMRGAWANLPWWAMVGILLVGDDMTQYWWHRISHSPLLWPLHRAHHSAEYMSIRVTYRNNFFYYLMMPGLWIAGVLLYLGFGGVFSGAIAIVAGVVGAVLLLIFVGRRIMNPFFAVLASSKLRRSCEICSVSSS